MVKGFSASSRTAMTLFAPGFVPCDLEVKRMSTMRSETTTEMRVKLHEKMRFTTNGKKRKRDRTRRRMTARSGEAGVSRG
jgi:hypothetical protein